MSKVYPLAISALLMLAACTNKPAANKTEPVLPGFEKTAVMPFSDSLQNDTFKVSLSGTTPNKSMLLFTITSFKGQLIYQQSISGSDLLKGESALGLKKDKERMAYLTNEVRYFFDEEHFLIPAVIPSETADNHVPDKTFYNELKQTALSGFNYNAGKDHKIYIAWSVKAQKVMIYYKCC